MSFWFELRYTLRLLQKNVWHSLLCAMIVSMCIGISWTALSTYYHLEMKPVPFEDSGQWYVIEKFDRETDTRPSLGFDAFAYQTFSSNLDSFDVFGAYNYQAASLTVGANSERVNRASISPDLFQATGITPAIGRGFTLDDSTSGNDAIAVLSYDLWVNSLAADPQILDRQILIDDQPHTIVGVMAEYSHFIMAFDIYTPFTSAAITQPGASEISVGTMAKLSANISVATANGEITSLVNALSEQYPEYYGENLEMWLTPVNEAFRISTSDWIFPTLSLVVITMIALGCISIGNLFIARTLERQHEFALRNALGSPKHSLVRQSLLESFAICFAGSLLGIGLSFLAVFGLVQMGEQIVSSGALGDAPFEISPEVLPIEYLFLAVLVIAIWLLCGLVPALKVAKQNPSEVLAGSAGSISKAGSLRSTKVLIIFQVICTCFALIVCGGGIYAISLTRTSDYGFTTEGIVLATLDLPADSYNDTATLLYMSDLRTEIESLPMIEALAFSDQLPGSGAGRASFQIEESSAISNQQFRQASVISISPDYLSTLAIEVVSGRVIDSTDGNASLPVALIDAELAKSLWSDADAIGKRIHLDPENSATWVTVVGVTSPVATAMSANRYQPVIYVPLSQHPSNRLHILAKAAAAPMMVGTELKRAAADVDRRVPLYRTLTMNEHLESLEANLLLVSNTFAVISLAALLMAITGIYGVVSRSILQRIREIGVRRAMGSTNWKIVRLFLRKTAIYLGIGCLIGGGPAVLILAAILDGPEDVIAIVPPIYLTVCLGLALFTAIATYLPTRRAISMEPGEALHYE